ncbi:hypothetical protein [Flavobacterium terrigena]|uniref:Uncharacterized protein n=1 Tax=Flavobacterium terrigena TaxID=402734 RepID=A0A1H6WNZ7_9FLAO|nr:hypothetical protein [Flavobacterium terrigena]SEJ18741.1 hypothetical protein SAMN05660918_2583 [Flavobacterium terrigena]
MKKISFLLIALFSIVSFAQKKQIILISSKYDFQNEKNSYNINNMLKAILTSNNYQVYFDDEILPMEIAQNRCNALTGILVDNSNLLLTKIKLQIKDCQNNLLFESAEVKSREKDIQTGFMECVKLLSPEIKKYKASLIQKKEVVIETPPEIIETPKVSEFKTYLNCSFKEVFNGFHVTEVRDSNGLVLLSMQKTKNPVIFIASRENATGVFTKTGNKGIFEYYIGDNYMIEEFSFN